MKTCELVSIGNELLTGLLEEQNIAFLSQEMEKLGFTVSAAHVLPDEPEELKKRLRHLLDTSPLVIATGGLGPTCDDNTKQVAAELFDSSMRFDDEVASALRYRYGDNLATLQQQATVPSRATVLPNGIGTAPALVFEAPAATLILLPGVPSEMKELFHSRVVPYLRANNPTNNTIYGEDLLIYSTKEQEVDPILRQLQEKSPELRINICPRPGTQWVHISTLQADKVQAKALVSNTINRLIQEYPDRAIAVPQGRIERAIHAQFISKQVSLSLAESCTGGDVSRRLCAIPGASGYFLGSVVSYSDDVKIHTLGVTPDSLENYGAVSKQVALQMAQGVRCLTGSSYGLSLTGIAGPGGATPTKPVGMVWIGWADSSGNSEAWHLQLRGGRAEVIEGSGTVALCRLLQNIT